MCDHHPPHLCLQVLGDQIKPDGQAKPKLNHSNAPLERSLLYMQLQQIWVPSTIAVHVLTTPTTISQLTCALSPFPAYKAVTHHEKKRYAISTDSQNLRAPPNPLDC